VNIQFTTSLNGKEFTFTGIAWQAPFIFVATQYRTADASNAVL
jgi:hypothetical protein